MSKTPLLVTTKNDNGDEISLMGGASLGAPATQETIVLMTPDGNGGRRAIPKMFDTYTIDTMDDLPENPKDGDQVIIQKAKMVTPGDSVSVSDSVISELFVAFDMDLSSIVGDSILALSACTFGVYSGALNIMFVEDASGAEMGVTGPIILIIYGSLEDWSLSNSTEYITKVSENMIWAPEEGISVPVSAGWNKLTKTNDVWSNSVITLNDIPKITNCVVAGITGQSTRICSYEPWLYIPISGYANAGTWHLNESVLPPFIYKFSEADDAHSYVIAHTMNLYSLEMAKIQKMRQPGFVGTCALLSGYISTTNSDNPSIHSGTIAETSVIKAALELRLTQLISSSYDVTGVSMSLSDFSYIENDNIWMGKFTYTNDATGQVVVEPISRARTVQYYN